MKFTYRPHRMWRNRINSAHHDHVWVYPEKKSVKICKVCYKVRFIRNIEASKSHHYGV